ncbi:uncharacterized protein LOC111025448 [Momordica charantia]|uniref:Uncharacterized protein LOC111025448 n=1 Tax=Momordica charantia TaxID=3673 RepID=A0A6J1DXL9_MOMCH|nr:uncharacterized protein LOC111025448 [Momordica charantia]
MEAPKTLKQLQCLNGRIAASNMFVSRSTDKCLPFFKVLRKKGSFEWTTECEQALEQLKNYLYSTPLLAKPLPGDKLHLYLAVSDSAVSSALIKQEGVCQSPIYYTSKAMTEAETRYPKMEKLALALVTSARRLRPYFQAHTVVVLTNLPLKNIFHKPETSGRLMKWAMELSEYDIQFEPRTTLKGKQWQTSSRSSPHHLSRPSPSSRGRSTLMDLPMRGGAGQESSCSHQEASDSNALAKLASAYETDLARLVLIEILDNPSILEPDVMEVDTPAPSWMDPIVEFIKGILQQHSKEENKWREKQLGSYSEMEHCTDDAKQFVKTYNNFQRFANIIHQPPELLTPISAPWPFAQWGIDIISPFPLGEGQTKFVVVAMDYFIKWAEAEGLAHITEPRVTSFIWMNIVCRFGIPNAIVTDNGKQFDNAKFKDFCMKLGISHLSSSPARPKANGQVEAINKIRKRGLKLKLDYRNGRSAEELPEVLWSYQTTPRESTSETPFSLAFGSEAMVPAEIGMPTDRIEQYEPLRNEAELLLNLDLLEGKRETAQLRLVECQNRMARHYNTRIQPRSFQVGHLVSSKIQSHVGTLDPSWEELFEVKGIVRPGTYMLADLERSVLAHPWNAEHLKRYYP